MDSSYIIYYDKYQWNNNDDTLFFSFRMSLHFIFIFNLVCLLLEYFLIRLNWKIATKFVPNEILFKVHLAYCLSRQRERRFKWQELVRFNVWSRDYVIVWNSFVAKLLNKIFTLRMQNHIMRNVRPFVWHICRYSLDLLYKPFSLMSSRFYSGNETVSHELPNIKWESYSIFWALVSYRSDLELIFSDVVRITLQQ